MSEDFDQTAQMRTSLTVGFVVYWLVYPQTLWAECCTGIWRIISHPINLVHSNLFIT